MTLTFSLSEDTEVTSAVVLDALWDYVPKADYGDVEITAITLDQNPEQSVVVGYNEPSPCFEVVTGICDLQMFKRFHMISQQEFRSFPERVLFTFDVKGNKFSEPSVVTIWVTVLYN